MRTRLRRLTVAAVALFTGATALPAAAAQSQGRQDQPSSGRLSAVVRYTEYGIPHITAKTYTDLGFGTGWAQAADQVCVLADGFVTVRGERSRWFGPDATSDQSLVSATTNLSSDLYFKGVRDARTVEKLLAEPAPRGPSRQAKDLMAGFTAGYNAWLRQNRVTDPACEGAPWVRPITTTDVAARFYALSILGGQGDNVDEITSARPPAANSPAPQADPQAVIRAVEQRTADASMGSNAVAFRGDTTANGRGLLLGNPHYPWHGGRRFWQSHQTIPGQLDVAGGSLLGLPTVSIGYNAHIAWSHTVSTGVPFNLTQLTLSPSDPTAYLVDGKPEAMTKRTVTVAVKDGAPVTRTQWWTRYGPVLASSSAGLPLPWTATTAFALNDPNAANLRFADTSLGFAKARDTAGIAASLAKHQGLPWVNTIAADSGGHTLYSQSQVLPRITNDLAASCSTPLGSATYPAAGLAVLDGSRTACAPGTDADAVQPGIFGPAKMPTLRDAAYVENSNDSPWLTNAEQPITGYERIFGNIGTQRGLRTRGAIQDVAALAERGKLTVRDLQAQQFANRVPAGDLAAADAAKACAALPGGQATGSNGTAVDVSEACGVLAAWDRTTDTGSRGALLFDRFWRKLPAQRWKVPFSAADPVNTPNTLNTDGPAFAAALADAVTELRSAGIALNSPLGEHQFVVRNGKRIPVPGGTEGLGVWNKVEGRWDPAGGGYSEISMGSSHIQAVGWDGSGCPVARTLLTYSQSSNPNSPHYADQTRLYGQERWVTARFCEKDVKASPVLRTVRVHS
ncbi:penicillin acylase family protein [Streptomyces niveiscabiei]|uniref:penicillin acylase family protein n=1 Tax=Streptomyces niveiscabiei TaxID=164115 RepID=UPI0029B47D06|nr:penicillin acylase family protein [Streptomyces niveiscabiei]MDX3382033.1 penicillin acylase family protein [Streptomyces niveiscabiei]